MNELIQQKQRQELAAEAAALRGEYDQAAVHAASAADIGLRIAERFGDSARQRFIDDAYDLIDLAEQLRVKARTSPPPADKPKNAGAKQPAAESSSAEQWVVREKPSVRFADIAGLEAVKQAIKLKMVYPFEHKYLAEQFGIRTGGGVLFYGPPGTGKTLLAKATAGEIDAAFFRISPGDILTKWFGEAEQNIKKLMAAAAAEKRAIIFIDEIEALMPARTDGGSGGAMQRVVPQFLQAMEGFDKSKGRAILFMGATNVPWQLDPAVLRPGRFDDKIYIPLPDAESRRSMLQAMLSQRPLAADLNLDAVADRLAGYSGADIKYICDRAAVIPFLQSIATGARRPITQKVLDDVLATAPKSVAPESLQRFEQWEKTMSN